MSVFDTTDVPGDPDLAVRLAAEVHGEGTILDSLLSLYPDLRDELPDGRVIVAEAPCGSWRVLEYDHGYQAVVRWCDRTGGACPWPATALASAEHGDGSQRECAAKA